MLARPVGGRGPRSHGVAVDVKGGRGHADVAARGVRDRRKGAPGGQVRVVDDLGGREHGCARNPRGSQRRQRILDRREPVEPLDDVGAKLRPVLASRGRCGEAGILREVGAAHHRGQSRP